MNHNFDDTYATPLRLHREKHVFTGGFCLSKLNIYALTADRSLFLHPKENSFFETLLYPKRQQDFLIGRYCAKKAVSILLQKDEFTQTCIENGVFQQPYVYHPSCQNLQISISHTENYGAALAFSEAHPMAIDIETICMDKTKTFQTQLTVAEQILAEKLVISKISQLTLLWTIKEALSKILKCGFMMPFEILEIAALNAHDGYIISNFKNFHQYQALSFLFNPIVCSFVYPRKTDLAIDIAAIQKALKI